MNNSFHNTVDLEGDELEKAEDNAKTQDEKVLKFFHENPLAYMTPSYVYDKLVSSGAIIDKVPKTSIRRAMSNLAKAHKIRKTGNKTKGPLGMVEHEWVYEPEGTTDPYHDKS